MWNFNGQKLVAVDNTTAGKSQTVGSIEEKNVHREKAQYEDIYTRTTTLLRKKLCTRLEYHIYATKA